MLALLSLALVLLSASTALGQESVPSSWLELAGSGSGDGVSGLAAIGRHPVMALNSSGQPVVAWKQETASGVKVYVRRWNGAAWVEFGGSGSGSGIWAAADTSTSNVPCIALDASGHPTVLWRDSGNGNWEIHLVRWNGSAWQELGGSASNGGISNFGGTSGLASVAVSPAGNPCVAWEESEGLHVRRWTGSSWESLSGLAAAYVASDDAYHPALALNPSGQPVLAWSQLVIPSPPGVSPQSEIRMKRWNGSAWVSFDGSADGNGVSGVYDGNPTDVDLALDASGNPVVAWHAGGPAEIFVRRWNGSACVEYGSSGSGGGISNNAAWSTNPSVVIGPGGHPVVSWSNQVEIGGPYETYVRRWNGSSWVEMEGSASGGGISASDAESTSLTNVVASAGGSVFVSWTEGNRAFLRYRPDFGVESLAQLHLDGATAIPVGGRPNLGAVVLRGTPFAILPPGQMRVQVEVRPVGIAFTGSATAESGLVASGGVVDIHIADLTGGSWHWAARAVTEGGAASEWVVFGGNAEGDADFEVPGGTIIPTTPAPASGGGGNGLGCGLLGLEAIGLLWLLRAGMRRVRRRLAHVDR